MQEKDISARKEVIKLFPSFQGQSVDSTLTSSAFPESGMYYFLEAVIMEVRLSCNATDH